MKLAASNMRNEGRRMANMAPALGKGKSGGVAIASGLQRCIITGLKGRGYVKNTALGGQLRPKTADDQRTVDTRVACC